jgi:hypothetical protein
MEAVRTSETSVDNHFTRQYNPEDSSEHHTCRRENLKSHNRAFMFLHATLHFMMMLTMSMRKWNIMNWVRTKSNGRGFEGSNEPLGYVTGNFYTSWMAIIAQERSCLKLLDLCNSCTILVMYLPPANEKCEDKAIVIIKTYLFRQLFYNAFSVTRLCSIDDNVTNVYDDK